MEGLAQIPVSYATTHLLQEGPSGYRQLRCPPPHPDTPLKSYHQLLSCLFTTRWYTVSPMAFDHNESEAPCGAGSCFVLYDGVSKAGIYFLFTAGGHPAGQLCWPSMPWRPSLYKKDTLLPALAPNAGTWSSVHCRFIWIHINVINRNTELKVISVFFICLPTEIRFLKLIEIQQKK